MENEIKFIVAIPTLNRADLLNEALPKYFEDFQNTEIVICDNGNQRELLVREEKFVIYRPEENLNVSGSWNMLMDYADKVSATHVLMLNDDVYLGRNEYEISKLIRLHSDAPFINSYRNWSSFILPVATFKMIGPFDQENFPNYFNDNDYCLRMRIAGLGRINTNYLDPEIYRNSMTIAKDPSLNDRFTEYQNTYIRKWGGPPSLETYIKPFNQ